MRRRAHKLCAGEGAVTGTMQAVRRGRGAGADLRWVFGYGSLMWRPQFPWAERAHGALPGFCRAFCIYSVHHRGTPERRGLVLGLAEGEGVRGVCYRVAEADWPAVYTYLLEREQPTETYIEAAAEVALDDGRRVQALVFLSDPDHPQWAGVLAPERQAQMIAGARGLSGRNADYLRDLVSHLREIGEPDLAMESLLGRVDALEAAL